MAPRSSNPNDHTSPSQFPAEAGAARQSNRAPVAVIDIGSNSVRLVVFNAISRAPFPIFNEKSACALAEGRDEAGNLTEAKMKTTLDILRHFASVCAMLHVEKTLAVATSAVRDAPNREVFIAGAEKILGTSIEVASGKREAELVKLGVEAGNYRASGVAGDLGGGSLELIEIGQSGDWESQTFPIGTIRTREAFQKDPKALSRKVKDTFMASPLMQKMAGKPFYAVGGVWRALGRIIYRRENPPFGVLHQFEISNEKLISLAKELRKKPLKEIDGIEAVSKSRRASLAVGARFLEILIKKGKPSKIVISVSGIREGLIAAQLSRAELAEDPLLVGMLSLCADRTRNPDYGRALYPFARALMLALGASFHAGSDRLLIAGSLLSECYWRVHPDHRGREALSDLTHISAYSLGYEDRLFLGFSLLARHEGRLDPEITQPDKTKLDECRKHHALMFGLVLRFAFSLSATTSEVLRMSEIKTSGNEVIIQLPGKYRRLESDALTSRQAAIEDLTGKSISLTFRGAN